MKWKRGQETKLHMGWNYAANPARKLVSILGWFTIRTRTSNDDVRVRGMLWILLQFGHIWVFSLRESLWSDLPVLLLNQPIVWNNANSTLRAWLQVIESGFIASPVIVEKSEDCVFGAHLLAVLSRLKFTWDLSIKQVYKSQISTVKS